METSTIHPQDEKKILAEINFKESQRKESIIRAEMKKILEDSKKMQSASSGPSFSSDK